MVKFVASLSYQAGANFTNTYNYLYAILACPVCKGIGFNDDHLFLVDQDVVVPLILSGARRPRPPEAEGDPHVRERDDGQRHEVLHDQQGNAAKKNN